ncbi:MAG: diacylglycerol kinase family lipid kinase [Bacteroidaceae bacterium]|nr:diacylglycerol kinase family lipid kinase [Bacteroidaceae bacterium]
MNTKKRVTFIVNPISGTQNKKGVTEKIKKYANNEKFDISIIPTQYAGHATEIAAQCAADGVDIVVAVGGDGTINETARALVHSNTVLGIIPCGSGNGLARHLRIPMDVQKAIEVINQCVVETIDYGKINDIPFFCTCGVGFDAFISMKFAQAGKRGISTYIENTLREGLRYEPETYEIENEDGSMKYEAFLITCANASQYGNNFYIAPKASLCDGLMDVIIMEPFTMLDAPAISFQMINGTIDQNSKIKTLRCKRLKIHRSKPGVIHFDGDPVMAEADLMVEIIEKGLQVIIGSQEDKPATNVNMWQSVIDAFNDLKPSIMDDLAAQNRRLQVLNKELLRKLKMNNHK